MALRLDTYDDIALAAGKDIADVVLARIAKLRHWRRCAPRTRWRAWRTRPSWWWRSSTAAAAHAGGRRSACARELDDAQGHATASSRSSSSAASAWPRSAADPADSIEDLMRLALQRLQRAPAAAPPPAPPPRRGGLPAELERVLRFLEGTDTARLRRRGGRVRPAAEDASPKRSRPNATDRARIGAVTSTAISTAARSPSAKASGPSRRSSSHWHKPFSQGARLLPAAVREVVRRRRDQPLLQRGRPPPRARAATRRRWSGSPPRSTRPQLYLQGAVPTR